MATLSEVLQKRVLAAVIQFKDELVAAGRDGGLVDEISVKETGQGVKVHFFASEEAKATTIELGNNGLVKPAPFDPDTLPLLGRDGHLIEGDTGNG